MSTPFDFLRDEFPELHREALQAGSNALGDPRTACFYARRVVELAVMWAFEHDRSLRWPYDRTAAKAAFADFLDDKRHNANQIEFVNLVIDELTQNGVIEPRRFYESPFTDLSPQGPDAIFESGDIDRLLEVVAEVRRRAEAA